MYPKTSHQKWIQQKNSPEINKDIYKATQEKFTALENIETEKSNKWIFSTYISNETERILKLLKKSGYIYKYLF